MPEVRYGGKEGKSIRLEVDPDLLVVRTRSRKSFRSGPVARPEAEYLQGMQMVADFPDAGVEVYRQTARATHTTVEAKSALRKAPDTQFAGSVLVRKDTGDPIIYTENLFIQFDENLDLEECVAILREAGLEVKDELSYATNAFFATAPEGTGQEIFTIASKLLKREDVKLCHPELVEPASRKLVFPQQWHLKTTVVQGTNVSASANVEAAHAITRGEGTVIAVIDDGFDLAHQEFARSGKVIFPRDFRNLDDDPSPADGDDHGTACAGVACADGAFGASGVAPAARLMPLRMPMSINSQRVADSFVWAADNGADVISCSWGPPDGRWWDKTDPTHNAFFPLADNVRLAMDYAVTKGRGGKGCLIFFAAGNGNESVDNDGYASYENILAVAASNDRGRRSVYSDFGNAVFCSFPSSDFGFPEETHPDPLTPGIWTTDRGGRDGYNPGGGLSQGDAAGLYTNSFGGTSSACPGAAGVAALVISRNPGLRRAEVVEILKQSCDRIDPQNGVYDANGHSPLYGFGRLNAERAASLALPTVAPARIHVERTFNEPVLDFQTSTVTLTVGEGGAIADLQVSIEIEHTYIGDLVVTLSPPSGSGTGTITLHRRTGGRTQNLRKTWHSLDFAPLAKCLGKNPQGAWKLTVRDEARRDVGTIRKFGVDIALAEEAPPRAVSRSKRASKPKKAESQKSAAPKTRSQKKAA